MLFTKTRFWTIFAALTGILLSGCQSEMARNMEVPMQAASTKSDASAPAPVGDSQVLFARSEEAETGEEPIPAMPRKIIYTAETEITTKNFDEAKETITQAVQKHKGYITESHVSGTRGNIRTGTWKVRIPVAQFDAFLRELSTLGDVENTRLSSEDVSEEYYDLEARLKNKRLEEERLIQHLKVSTGKLSEILAVEREISRVRGEIERMEGRQRFLANQTEMTTITVTVREMPQLVPTTAPGLPNQVGRVFMESLAVIALVGRSLLLFAVALLPWIGLGAIVAVPLWYIVKRRAQARKGAENRATPHLEE